VPFWTGSSLIIGYYVSKHVGSAKLPNTSTLYYD